jgi:hypothetical protein
LTRYRLYFIDPSPRHIRQVAEFEAADDEEARTHAHSRHDGRALELWRDDQMIQSFPARRH